jgi:hypothetical protein
MRANDNGPSQGLEPRNIFTLPEQTAFSGASVW